MNKERQIELLAAVIAQTENKLFVERLEELFWQYQSLGSKQYNQILSTVQAGVKMLENKLPFLKDKLKAIEDGTFDYEANYKK